MIEFKTGLNVIDWNSLIQMYKAVDLVVGLARAGKIDKIKKSFNNTYKIVTAWDVDKIVGAGRLISDGECYGWIHDVGVHPDYQKRGVGRGIMKELINDNEHLLLGLTSSFEAVDFYKKLNFKKHKTAMAIYPGKSTYLED